LKRALVTGAAGLLGQHLIARLQGRYKIDAIDIAENPFQLNPNLTYHRTGLTEPDAMNPLFAKDPPEIIFNCAAYTDVDGCEKHKDMALELNVGIVMKLLNFQFGKIVQFSTDYVFNGQSGPYSEDDDVDPIGYYGETKLESERILLSSGAKCLIVRTNVLFGNGKNIRPNFITWLIEKLGAGDKLRIVTDQFNNPIHADNLAETSIEAAESDVLGILNLGGSSYLSRYDMAVKTADYIGADTGLIEPIATSDLGQTARRPLRGGLKIDKALKLLKTKLLSFDAALKLMESK